MYESRILDIEPVINEKEKRDSNQCNTLQEQPRCFGWMTLTTGVLITAALPLVYFFMITFPRIIWISPVKPDEISIPPGRLDKLLGQILLLISVRNPFHPERYICWYSILESLSGIIAIAAVYKKSLKWIQIYKSICIWIFYTGIIYNMLVYLVKYRSTVYQNNPNFEDPFEQFILTVLLVGYGIGVVACKCFEGYVLNIIYRYERYLKAQKSD